MRHPSFTHIKCSARITQRVCVCPLSPLICSTEGLWESWGQTESDVFLSKGQPAAWGLIIVVNLRATQHYSEPTLRFDLLSSAQLFLWNPNKLNDLLWGANKAEPTEEPGQQSKGQPGPGSEADPKSALVPQHSQHVCDFEEKVEQLEQHPGPSRASPSLRLFWGSILSPELLPQWWRRWRRWRKVRRLNWRSCFTWLPTHLPIYHPSIHSSSLHLSTHPSVYPPITDGCFNRFWLFNSSVFHPKWMQMWVWEKSFSLLFILNRKRSNIHCKKEQKRRNRLFIQGPSPWRLMQWLLLMG